MKATTKERVKVEVTLDDGSVVKGTTHLISHDYEFETEEYEYCEAGYVYWITEATIDEIDEDDFEAESDEEEEKWQDNQKVVSFKVLEDEASLEWETDDYIEEYMQPDPDDEYDRMREREW